MATNYMTNSNENKILYKELSYLVFVAISILFVAIRALPARGAELYFGSHGREIGAGKVSEVGVFLDTEEESVNAIEGEIVFSQDLSLEFKEIRDGSSIISFWVKKPILEDFTIPFSGIVPGGYNGKEGYLFSVFFEAKDVGGIIVGAEGLRVLKSDPAGSPVSVRVSPLTLAVTEDAPAPEVLPPGDILPPESFTPEVIKNQNLFNGKWALVFSAQDKGSGLDQYQVKEEKETTLFGVKLRKGEWVSAESPYLLRDQGRRSTIFVKAIDKTGNERIETVPRGEKPAWYDASFLFFPFAGAVLLIVLYAARKIIWKTPFGKKI